MVQLVENNIENLIYEIRGKQVMIDSDLAKLYGCKNGTKTINLAVKRHINRFPERFYFQLNKNEFMNLRFQNETTNFSNMKRSLPYAFTEEGVAMLSSVLRTPIAEEISIRIMDAFVNLRKYVNDYEVRLGNLETKIIDYDNKFAKLFEALDKKEKQSHIFFEGQIYDAYSLLVDILKETEEEIIIIDNYIDKQILDITSLLGKKVTIITNKYNNIDIEKYKEQYSNLNVKINNKFHDRFIIIDRNLLYHSGASFKDLGNKCFSINKIEDKEYIAKILEKIKL